MYRFGIFVIRFVGRNAPRYVSEVVMKRHVTVRLPLLLLLLLKVVASTHQLMAALRTPRNASSQSMTEWHLTVWATWFRDDIE
jgi:hypothetical protein